MALSMMMMLSFQAPASKKRRTTNKVTDSAEKSPNSTSSAKGEWPKKAKMEAEEGGVDEVDGAPPSTSKQEEEGSPARIDFSVSGISVSLFFFNKISPRCKMAACVVFSLCDLHAAKIMKPLISLQSRSFFQY